MNNKISIKILIILLGLVLLSIGFYAGFLLGTDKAKSAKPQDSVSCLEKVSKMNNLVGSKVIQGVSIYAVGEVTKISGRSITVTSEGEALEIPISNDAETFIMVSDKTLKNNYVPEAIGFAEIKVGDMVTIAIKIKLNGEFEGTAVRVFPKTI